MTDNPVKLYDAARGAAPAVTSVAHVRFEGRSRDIALELISILPQSSDDDIRNAVAHFMEMPPALLRYHVGERHANGNITVRPQAVFG